MNYTIQNDEIRLTVATHGAEIRSLQDVKTGEEYMWQADPTYWNRTAPVLFPVVGKYRNQTSYYEGRAYQLGQHGFARDMAFTLISQSGDALCFAVEDTPETLEKYPFPFRLEIGYQIHHRTVAVSWKVINKTDGRIYFSIGAHPAFNCVLGEDAIAFDTKAPLTAQILNGDGLVSGETKTIYTEDGRLRLTDELFAQDALVLEDRQTQEISIIRAGGRRLLTVSYDAPLVGIWSPVGKHAPFICIEPWYGRADRADYDGDLTGRAYGNALDGGERFTATYSITV